MVCVRTVLVVILGYMCATSVRAQRETCQHRTVPVSVMRNDGVPVHPLATANFEGSYRKKPVLVTSVAVPHEPSRVVLLVDVSGSMRNPRSESNWNFMVDVAENLLSGLPPDSEVGLGFFSNELEPFARPTTDRKSLLNQLESLRSRKAFGQTALWAAILDSLKMFDGPHLGDVIYVITDGEDTKSKITMSQVTQTLNESGVRLFAFLFQELSFNAGMAGPRNSSPMDVVRITENTGGSAIGFATSYQGDYFAGTPSQDPALVDKSGKPTWLGSNLRLQYQEMFNFYRVDFDLPEIVDKIRDWKLVLMGFDRSQQDDFMLKYPHMLVPCR